MITFEIVAESNNNYYTNNKTKIVTSKINKIDNNMNVIYKCTKLNKTFLQLVYTLGEKGFLLFASLR